MPRTFSSLAELLEALPGAINRGLQTAADGIGFTVATRARSKLGTYQPGWAPLSAWALLDHGGADTPLELTGVLGDSIADTVDPIAGGYRVVVGSDAPQARIQEFGGPTALGTYIPPRPYLAPSVVESEDAIQQAVALSIVREIEKL
jgi:phage gpG-like protein